MSPSCSYQPAAVAPASSPWAAASLPSVVASPTSAPPIAAVTPSATSYTSGRAASTGNTPPSSSACTPSASRWASPGTKNSSVNSNHTYTLLEFNPLYLLLLI